MNVRKLIKSLVIGYVAITGNGCSIYMAAHLPIERSPEKLTAGKDRQWVDRTYGYPLATGVLQSGDQIEQIQFINGTPIGWKVARICTHGTLDALTYCLWELIGTPIELTHSDYPTHLYYVIYDADNKIVRAVDGASEEGVKISKMDWSIPFVDGLKVNLDDKVRVRSQEEQSSRRQELRLSAMEELKKKLEAKIITEKEYENSLQKMMEESK